MNWLLPAVVVFLILAAWDGHRKGFIKKLVGIVSLVLTLVLTSAASPLVAEFLKEHQCQRRRAFGYAADAWAGRRGERISG